MYIGAADAIHPFALMARTLAGFFGFRLPFSSGAVAGFIYITQTIFDGVWAPIDAACDCLGEQRALHDLAQLARPRIGGLCGGDTITIDMLDFGV